MREKIEKSESERGNCERCGREIIHEKGAKRKRFCSDECRKRWWSLNREELRHREPCVIQCAACGVTFVVTKSSQNRKYCCHEHYVAAKCGREVTPNLQKATKLPVLIEAIEKEAPMPVFEESSERIASAPEEPIPMFSVRAAREGERLNPKRVYLLAGTSKFQGKYDHFASLVPLVAEEALLNGDVFVFCNTQRTQLSVLQWQGDGFALFFKRTEFNRYPWPAAWERKLIEITPIDLRLLLEIPSLMRRLYGISGG